MAFRVCACAPVVDAKASDAARQPDASVVSKEDLKRIMALSRRNE